MKNTKTSLRFISLLLCLVLFVYLAFVSCGEEESTETPNTDNSSSDSPSDYSDLDLSKCIKLGNYKGLVVDAKDSSEDIALWEMIVSKCEVLEYPADSLSYYMEQTKEKYKLYAEKGNMSYEELMTALDKTDEDIEKEAKDLVKKDLVTLAIVKAEGLELTDKEKTDLFDKYADLYIDLYGYTEEYIRENLTDEIYDSMQYDKMMEYLIKQNFFVAKD